MGFICHLFSFKSVYEVKQLTLGLQQHEEFSNFPL